ncbi:DUF6624 domain-containing protein [Chryseobacterium gleum]|uniref:DUF6624 domain-containing protein n=1 Tax=Chryseobacterium gleum TaxID=250 RepID=UPI0031D6B76F
MGIKIIIFIFTFSILSAQPEKEYQVLISKASLYHLQKNPDRAIPLYEKAFQIQEPDALNAYKAAGVYALKDNHIKAFYFLKLALSKGWTEAQKLSEDPYFKLLKIHNSQRWKQLQDQAFTKESQFITSLTLPDLREEINHLANVEQNLRYKRAQANADSENIKKVDNQIRITDSMNYQKAKEIIQKYGWPKKTEIGNDGQNNLWLIIQHADHDVLFQKKVLKEMEKIKGTNELNLENYAFLYDRVRINLNYKQLYGTQVNWTVNGEASSFKPIEKEGQVDSRRTSMRLPLLGSYALSYGFTYDNITVEKSQQNEYEEHQYVYDLIMKAKNAYQAGKFQDVYDFYNQASMVLGGMSNEENYDAARVFSTIALKTNEQKYKEIALDFLNLLYVREMLNKDMLLKCNDFKILYNEERWKNLFNKL